MKVGDLVRCWWKVPDDFTQGPVMTGILMYGIDAPDEVSVYIPSMKNVYWFPEGEHEVICESR